MAWERLIKATRSVVPKRQLFTSDGVWPVPTNLVPGSVAVTMTGGGSSGQLGSSTTAIGGAPGDFVVRLPVDVSAVSSVSVVVGAGGSERSGAGNEGVSPGAPSSFGAFVSVNGGNFDISHEVKRAGDKASAGVFGAPTRTYGNGQFNSFVGSAGLLLDENMELAGEGQGYRDNVPGGFGYGAGGGAGTSSVTAGAGAPGAVLVEWLETE